ncbi:MAG: Hsp20/alpha crystallin family protein [Sphaerochaetaceae bacterium]|nr:Hsp20/alpha crystallin family protein [Sphaerochaetaceae bacterium]
MRYYLTNNNVNDMAGDLNNLFGDFFDNLSNPINSKVPSVDIFEDASFYTIEAELPGFKEENVSINVEKHVLNLKSLKEEENKKDERKVLIRERNSCKFERSFRLPEGVDEEKISAEFSNGVLKILVPKMPEVQPKAITVKIK